MRCSLTFMTAGLLFAGAAHADDRLSCALGKERPLAAPAPIREFLWSTAHGEVVPDGGVRTRLGLIEPGEDEGHSTSILLDGVPIALPSGLSGLIRFGQIYDLGGQVALAYLVERPDDSSASPSQVVLRLDKTGRVTASDLIPGDADPAPGQCRLIN